MAASTQAMPACATRSERVPEVLLEPVAAGEEEPLDADVPAPLEEEPLEPPEVGEAGGELAPDPAVGDPPLVGAAVPALTDAVWFKQLELLAPAFTVKGADCARLPSLSRIVMPREVPVGSLTSQVREVPV